MKYYELKQRIQNEVNNFPMFFAFSDDQFKEGLEKFGATPSELFRHPSSGFYRKTDAPKLHAMINRHNQELEAAMQDDDFMIDAIRYELANHEYCITFDRTDTVEALGLDMADERTLRCFKAAGKLYADEMEAAGIL